MINKAGDVYQPIIQPPQRRFDFDRPLAEIPPQGQSYESSNQLLCCIGTSLFCVFVTLQSHVCDFAITGSVFQSWFKPNSWLIKKNTMINLCIEIRLKTIF